MLIGQHQQLLAVLPRPLHHGRGIRRGADDPAVFADERFDGGGRIDVGDRDEAGAVLLDRVCPDAHLAKLAPAHVELIRRGHVGHGTSGREIRQDDFLMGSAKNVCALGHEVDAAEDDELRLPAACSGARQLQGIADVVGKLDDLVALIMVSEDHHAVAERLLRGRDSLIHLVV